MRQTAFQGILQGAGHVAGRLRGLFHRQLLADIDEVPQVAPLDELHRQIELALVLPHFINRNDVFVLERLAQFGLALEFGDGLGILRKPRTQHLQAQHLSGVQVLGSKDPCETA